MKYGTTDMAQVFCEFFFPNTSYGDTLCDKINYAHRLKEYARICLCPRSLSQRIHGEKKTARSALVTVV